MREEFIARQNNKKHTETLADQDEDLCCIQASVRPPEAPFDHTEPAVLSSRDHAGELAMLYASVLPRHGLLV